VIVLQNSVFCLIQATILVIYAMINRLKRIYYADDDENDHFFMRHTIEELFPRVEFKSFYYCEKLLEYLKDEAHELPDLIFLDQNLPGMSGTECLGIIKTSPGWSHIPVIIYSTGASEKDRAEAQSFGAYKYLIKPGTYNEIKSLLGKVILELTAEEQP